MRKPFSWHFPILYAAVRRGIFVALALGFLAMCSLAMDAREVALGLVLIGAGILGLWLDRRWYAVWPLPPVAWFSSVCIFAGGLGPILLWISGASIQNGDLGSMQLGMLVGHAFFFVTWVFVRPRAESCPSISDVIINNLDMRKAVFGACFLFFAFGISETIVGAVSGASDRGLAGESAAYEVFGYWSYFVAFNRLTPLAFLLAPLGWRYANVLGRGLIIAASFLIVLMNAIGGSRYLALTPLVLVLIGHLCFSARHRLRTEWLLIAVVPLAVMAFVYLDHYRNTETFQREALSDPLNKVKAMGEVRLRAAESPDSQLYIIAERLVGNIDPLIYQATPSFIPHAGFDGIAGLLWLYVPTFFYSNRPSMVDAPIIGEKYLQSALIRTSVGSSFTGDWYRRFGWIGVALGMGLVAVILAFSLRALVWALRDHPFFSVAAVLVVSTFATKDANMTVSTATWLFLYDFPKYIFAIVALFSVGRFIAPIFSTAALYQPEHNNRKAPAMGGAGFPRALQRSRFA